MDNLTLVTVNWNQKEVMELMLRSYVHHHYKGEKLKLLLCDNGSTDGSMEWLNDNNIPHVQFAENVGHENAINLLYNDIKTPLCLLVDTDVEFRGDVSPYRHFIRENTVSVGELITGDNLGTPIRPRISPWFWMFDIEKMKSLGVNTFRTTADCAYDVGSEFWERMMQNGLTNLNLIRNPGHIDRDIEGMVYAKFVHYGKMSWDLEKHGDRYDEVMRRRAYVKQRLELYKDIDLTDKFIMA